MVVFVFVSGDRAGLDHDLVTSPLSSRLPAQSGQTGSCCYESLAENCEFRVTVSFLILFAIFLNKFIPTFPDVAQTTSEALLALCPIFTAFIMVKSNHLLDARDVFPLDHPPPGLCSENTPINSGPGRFLEPELPQENKQTRISLGACSSEDRTNRISDKGHAVNEIGRLSRVWHGAA